MFRRFEGSRVIETERNEIKQPNRPQRDSCCFYWRSMLIMTWATSQDIEGARARSGQNNNNNNNSTDTHISPYVSFSHCESIKDSSSDISSHIIQIWGEREREIKNGQPNNKRTKRSSIFSLLFFFFLSLYSSKSQHETVKSTWVTTTVASREARRTPHTQFPSPITPPPLFFLFFFFFGNSVGAAGTIRGYQKG